MTRVLPVVGDELLLSVPQGEQVLARVTDEGPGFFDLALLERPTTPQRRLTRMALTIEFVNDDGVARMHGRLDATGYATAESLTEVVRFAHRGSPQLLLRREFVRATVDLGLTLWLAEADDTDVTSTHAHAIDLSGGGMLVAGLLGRVVVGDELRFALELADGGTTVNGRGRVARLETADRVGLQFVDVADADRARLQVVAFEMSRDQHRRVA